ncbi:MAG: hypothetical protein SPI77_00730 [Corynebacterium sp.]|nr:hypothetical protein [Corynebacterium sp.]
MIRKVSGPWIAVTAGKQVCRIHGLTFWLPLCVEGAIRIEAILCGHEHGGGFYTDNNHETVYTHQDGAATAIGKWGRSLFMQI